MCRRQAGFWLNEHSRLGQRPNSARSVKGKSSANPLQMTGVYACTFTRPGQTTFATPRKRQKRPAKIGAADEISWNFLRNRQTSRLTREQRPGSGNAVFLSLLSGSAVAKFRIAKAAEQRSGNPRPPRRMTRLYVGTGHEVDHSHTLDDDDGRAQPGTPHKKRECM